MDPSSSTSPSKTDNDDTPAKRTRREAYADTSSSDEDDVDFAGFSLTGHQTFYLFISIYFPSHCIALFLTITQGRYVFFILILSFSINDTWYAYLYVSHITYNSRSNDV